MSTTSSANQIFEILYVICQSDEPLGAAQISRRLAIPLSTVHRGLMTLEHTGFIMRYRHTPKFQPGPEATRVSHALYRRWPIHNAAQPLVQAIARSTSQTTALCVPLGFYAVRILAIPGSGELYHARSLGEYALWDRCEAGLTFLQAEPDSRKAYLDFLKSIGRKPRPSPMRSISEHPRNGRVALVNRSPADGALNIAAPLLTRDGGILATIVVNFASGLGESEEAEIVEGIVASIADFERALDADAGAIAPPFQHVPREEIVLTL